MAGPVRAAWSRASDGDLRPSPGNGGDPLARWAAEAARGAAGAGPGAVHGTGVTEVRWLAQVHGAEVVGVGASDAQTPRVPGFRPVARWAGTGDALVTADPGVALAVLTADCGAVALGSPEGVCAAVHAGWRGLASGVVEAAVDAMRAHGATEVTGALGPCIHAECYAFTEDDLAGMAALYGDGVRGRTADGSPALDLPGTIRAALTGRGVREVAGQDACTACSGGHFSHRARADRGRQALVVWAGPGAGRRWGAAGGETGRP